MGLLVYTEDKYFLSGLNVVTVCKIELVRPSKTGLKACGRVDIDLCPYYKIIKGYVAIFCETISKPKFKMSVGG